MKAGQRGKVDEITELVGHALCLAGEIRKAIEAIAQPVQEAEPVGYVDERVVYWLSDRRGKASAQITTNLSAVKCAERPMPLYTAPQPVQPLTVDQIDSMAVAYLGNPGIDPERFARAIEAAHNIKGSTE